MIGWSRRRHFAMLATLSMGVLGAMHQFIPVITQRPLRSVQISRATFLSWLVGAWLLPFGFATQREFVVEAGGAFAALAVTLLVVNVSVPLSVRGKGAPVTGLRLSIVGFVVTACYGVVYVIDRRGNWFDLSGHVVLAHATVGLFAWLGLTYVSVAEKLWPMFLLAHVPGRRRCGMACRVGGPQRRAPAFARAALRRGVVGVVRGGNLGRRPRCTPHLADDAHPTSPAEGRSAPAVRGHGCGLANSWLCPCSGSTVDNRATSPCRYGIGGSSRGGILRFGCLWRSWATRTSLPFILWSALRGRGVEKKVDGTPLMFADLYDHRWAAIVCGIVTAGNAAVCLGFAARPRFVIAIGGGLFVVTGLCLAANLSMTATRLLAAPSSDGHVTAGQATTP